MKSIFDNISYRSSQMVTEAYSTSFSLAVRMLSPSIRQDIYNIYGFVRFADEIVDSFHNYPKQTLLDNFEAELHNALQYRISLNPILNAFQETVHTYSIDKELIDAFMHSMRQDLTKTSYTTTEEYQQYIYGSADVVGLMCLKVFVKGNSKRFLELKNAAMSLGSAFQKVNFLRDLKNDQDLLQRTYFPGTNLNRLDEAAKALIINEIEEDFKKAYAGIKKLPIDARFGVYTAYKYYHKLLQKLKDTPSKEIRNARIRVPNYQKFGVLAKCYVNYRLNLL